MPNQILTENQLQALLRIKRHEQPPPGYFDELLNRIHRRQREEMLRQPAWQIAVERVRAFLAPFRVDRAYAASLAFLLVIGVGVIRIALPEIGSQDPQFASISDLNAGRAEELTSKSESQPFRIPLGPRGGIGWAAVADRQPSGNQVVYDEDVPTRFVIDTQPVSYETRQFRF